MRFPSRALILGLLAAMMPPASARRAMADDVLDLGIIIDAGTVQPVGDPNYVYQFDVEFKPDPTLHDFIQNGDSFTVFLTGNNGVIAGTNTQPLTWSATAFSPGSVTWTYIGNDPITSATPLDPLPGPLFQVVSTIETSGTFTYTFRDSLPGQPGGHSGGGSFTVTAVPEPTSMALIGLGIPALVLLRRRSRRVPGPA